MQTLVVVDAWIHAGHVSDDRIHLDRVESARGRAGLEHGGTESRAMNLMNGASHPVQQSRQPGSVHGLSLMKRSGRASGSQYPLKAAQQWLGRRSLD